MTEVMTAKQYNAKYHGKKKRAKYGNRKVKRDGMVFDSEKEYKRWGELKLLEKAGKIVNIQRQVKFDLGVCFYVADFTYDIPLTDKITGRVTEDVKGYKTQLYKLKKKLMYQVHGIEIKEV